MITKKDRIRALAKLNGLKETDNFPKCLAYFLKSSGYEIINENDHIPYPMFKTCTNLKKVVLEFDHGGSYILKTPYDNFPIIEIHGKEKDLIIYIDHIKYDFNGFVKWYEKSFESKI